MEQVCVRYPTKEYRTYRPGSKGLNVHYKAYREQFYGEKGILQTSFKEIHRNPSVGQYTDQRGIPSFAYKIPNGKIYKTAPLMDKIPRGGNVPRVVGTVGDVDIPNVEGLQNAPNQFGNQSQLIQTIAAAFQAQKKGFKPQDLTTKEFEDFKKTYITKNYDKIDQKDPGTGFMEYQQQDSHGGVGNNEENVDVYNKKEQLNQDLVLVRQAADMILQAIQDDTTPLESPVEPEGQSNFKKRKADDAITYIHSTYKKNKRNALAEVITTIEPPNSEIPNKEVIPFIGIGDRIDTSGDREVIISSGKPPQPNNGTIAGDGFQDVVMEEVSEFDDEPSIPSVPPSRRSSKAMSLASELTAQLKEYLKQRRPSSNRSLDQPLQITNGRRDSMSIDMPQRSELEIALIEGKKRLRSLTSSLNPKEKKMTLKVAQEINKYLPQNSTAEIMRRAAQNRKMSLSSNSSNETNGSFDSISTFSLKKEEAAKKVKELEGAINASIRSVRKAMKGGVNKEQAKILGEALVNDLIFSKESAEGKKIKKLSVALIRNNENKLVQDKVLKELLVYLQSLKRLPSENSSEMGPESSQMALVRKKK